MSRHPCGVHLTLTLVAEDDVMIALTATVRPVELPVLGQDLRRHCEHTLLFTDQMFVIFPEIGAVRVTERPSKYRFDIVGTDQATVDQRVMKLEADVRMQTSGQRILFDWARASHVPVPLR